MLTQYAREEPVYVKTQLFVTVRQTSGQDDMEYFLQVERLSRKIELGQADTREILAVVLAIIGLQDVRLSQELMAKMTLDCVTLTGLLRSTNFARQACNMLTGSFNDNDNAALLVGLATLHYCWGN